MISPQESAWIPIYYAYKYFNQNLHKAASEKLFSVCGVIIAGEDQSNKKNSGKWKFFKHYNREVLLNILSLEKIEKILLVRAVS